MFKIVKIFNKIMMFMEHDLQKNTFCNVFMSFYSCRTYVVYSTTVNMWTRTLLIKKTYIYKKLCKGNGISTILPSYLHYTCSVLASPEIPFSCLVGVNETEWVKVKRNNAY